MRAIELVILGLDLYGYDYCTEQGQLIHGSYLCSSSGFKELSVQPMGNVFLSFLDVFQ